MSLDASERRTLEKPNNSTDKGRRRGYARPMSKLCRSILLIGLSCVVCRAAPLERWIYCSQNLWVDKNVDQLEALFQRAHKAGYTHVLLSDSKFSKLAEMDARYFRN